MTYIRKNYVLNTFAPKEKIKYVVRSKDTLDIAPDEVLRLDGKIDILKLDEIFIINNLSMIQKDGDFKKLITNDATVLLDQVKKMEIIDNFDDFKNYAEDFAVAMKLASIKNESCISPIPPKDKIIEFIKKRPSLKNAMKLEGGKIKLQSKIARKYFLHIIADDYVRSLINSNVIYKTESKKKAPEASIRKS